MKRLAALVVLLCLSACGSDGPTGPGPGPNPGPGTQTITFAGTVTETAPTTTTRISGAVVTFVDGTNANKSATTDGSGNYQITGVNAGGFTVRVTAPGYLETSRGVTINANATGNFELDPVPQILTSSRNESVSGGDACVGGPSTFGDGCKQYAMNLHHSGTIDAVVTWDDRDTWLWLELFRNSDGQMIASASSSRVNGLRQQVTATGQAHTQYIIRVRYALGARITPFALTVTRPN